MKQKAKCFDCNRPYGIEHGFPDLVIPDWAWLKIFPKNYGLLCPSCICKRLYEVGIENCPAKFDSGPLAFEVKNWIRS